MIRVLHIVTYMGRGGLETMLMNYYRQIDRKQVQFDFLVHRDFEADYDREILEMGGKIHRVSRLIPWSRAYREELKAFFRSHPEYRIVHVHQDCLSSVALKAAKDCGVPTRIAHAHSASQDRNWKYFIKRHYMKQIPTYATDLFACGAEAGNWMFGGARFQIVSNAIDSKKYVYSAETAARVKDAFGLRDALVVGHVGRFDPVKNHVFLLDVFRELVSLRPDARLLLVGKGQKEAEIRQKAERLGLQDKVVFAGLRNDVHELMQAMDVFVFPSLYEGLSVVTVEAQTAGLPCLLSDRISDECICTEGLVRMKSLNDAPQDWAKEILRCAETERTDRRQEIAERGFDIVSAAEALQTFYLSKQEKA